jgi:hypothetical protein
MIVPRTLPLDRGGFSLGPGGSGRVSDLRVAGVSDRVQREPEQPRGDDAQQKRSIGVVQQLVEGSVEADRATRVESPWDRWRL